MKMPDKLKQKYIKQKPNTWRYVIADIHGCAKTVKKLVEEVVVPSKSDQLFLLGDYIDRGPASGEVIDYILYLIEQGYAVYPLHGNHEENMLDDIKEYGKESLEMMVRKITKCPDLLDECGSLKERYVNFMQSLPYYYEMDDCFLVHAGFDFKKPEPFQDYSAMIQFYIDNESYDTSVLNEKRMIHGHRITEIDYIEKLVNEKSQIISLDNGCAYRKKHKIYDYTKLGNLCCLELNSACTKS
ncbi:MAG: metallophosphoesterase [Salinivirgaceae bacterium]|nr:metallophosphoesterase [Salinivirgaceae bacterium]